MKPGDESAVAGLRLSAGCVSHCESVSELLRKVLRSHLLTSSYFPGHATVMAADLCRAPSSHLHKGHQMKRSSFLPLLVLACSNATPPERYGFVALLGNDTVSVERIARSPTRLVTDGVDRWPFVRRRHTEFDLAADGRIRHMVMDVRTPNGRSPRERGRRVTAEFSNEAVTISVRDSSGERDTSFATGGSITVPHASMMYSVIELEIAAALRRAAASGLAPGDSVLFRQFYPDRDVGPSFTLHRGYVHPHAGGKVELRHDWLAGTGDVTVDSSGRMLTYSGMRSTYKVSVARTTTLPVLGISQVTLFRREKRLHPGCRERLS
jgi:hypothetical protein